MYNFVRKQNVVYGFVVAVMQHYIVIVIQSLRDQVYARLSQVSATLSQKMLLGTATKTCLM